MIRVILLLAVFICSSTGGEIAITYGMKDVGEPERLRPRYVLSFLGRALRNGWFWTGIPLMGGVAPAMSAVEALTRDLSAELAPHGIRVVGLRPQGMPDSGTIKEVFGLHAKAWGISWEQFQELIVGRTHTRRLSSLSEMANVAALAASDQASGLTGTIVNLSLGSLDD